MYKIYADNILIYDSTMDDYRIGEGTIELEAGKSGSFVFSLYPDHFYYDLFVRRKTVIKVCKDNKIVFRGRILSDESDYNNRKVITCEGELGFLLDSIIRPYEGSYTPETLFKKYINEHNSQVDDFKRFNVGAVSVIDPNNYIARNTSDYKPTLDNINEHLIESASAGYLYVTHGDDGMDEIPTIHYISDFPNICSQTIEFGVNMKDYLKSVDTTNMATAIIPTGKTLDKPKNSEITPKVTIASVNNGVDYIFDQQAVDMFGWIFANPEWNDVEKPENLLAKAKEYLKECVNQITSLELTAIDLHLLDKSIDSFTIGDYIRVISEPHNIDTIMLCSQQSLDLLNPANDTVVLGRAFSTFTERSNKVMNLANNLSSISTSGGGGAVYAVYSITVPSTDWVTQDDGTNTQTVTVDGLLATNTGYVDIDLSLADVSTVIVLQNAWAKIGRVQTIDNGVTFICYNGAPTVNLPVMIGVFTNG